MLARKPYLFASYSMKDRQKVLPFLDVLAAEGVEVFSDQDLRPGEDWAAALESALSSAAGVLVFVSPRSVQSEWVRREISAVGTRLLVPVILEYTPEMSEDLRRRQWVDLSGVTSDEELRAAAASIARVYAELDSAPEPRGEVSPSEHDYANELARELRRGQPEASPDEPPDSVFVVHGHDLGLRDEVVAFLEALRIRPIVLTNILGASQSLLQKFFQFAGEARFAIILLSADDRGASRRQFDADGVGERALRFRARQNVILEMGFFYGRLGWENVFVLAKKPDQVFPDFERPSDLDGAIFDPVDEEGLWKGVLYSRLAEARFDVPALDGDGRPLS